LITATSTATIILNESGDENDIGVSVDELLEQLSQVRKRKLDVVTEIQVAHPFTITDTIHLLLLCILTLFFLLSINNASIHDLYSFAAT
jgi:hypothetical protein